MELAGAKAAITRGKPYGDVYPQLAAEADRLRLADWFVASTTVPNLKARAAPPAEQAGYSGDQCPKCSSIRVIRNGSCLLCTECGETSGCT